MGSSQITRNQIYLDLIEIFQFCLKIQHLWRFPHPWVGVWMVGWVDGWGSGQITKNQIYLDLIEIFQFCLKIQHLWRFPHRWVGVWVVGWVDGWGQVKSLEIKYTLT